MILNCVFKKTGNLDPNYYYNGQNNIFIRKQVKISLFFLTFRNFG